MAGGPYLHDVAAPVNDPPRGLCLDCDYPLRDLPDRRCPECGRSFDSSVTSTMNPGPPLGPWRRRLLRPIGWPTFAVAAVPLALYLRGATDPDVYYMGAQYAMGMLALVAVGIVQLARWVPKSHLERRLGRRSKDSRWRWYWCMAGATLLLVVFKVPLRLAFMASRAELEEAVAVLRANPLASLAGRRVGAYTVLDHTDYGTPDAPIILIHTSPSGGGFRYSPGGPERFGYNPGDEGHLSGPWYWFASD